MTKEQINPPSVFRSLDHGFPQAVTATGKRTLYISGQTAWDAHRNLVGGSDLGAQARQAFRNLGAVLEAAGAQVSDVVSLRIYVVDYKPGNAVAVGTAYRQFFTPAAAPATTWVGVASLADPGFLIEVEAVAVVD
jgi:enamine deaminase RidA (YjgF/YER057c/UK114 family)